MSAAVGDREEPAELAMGRRRRTPWAFVTELLCLDTDREGR